MDRNIPSMERAYRELRPLLFGALGKLTRQGFAVPLTDSMDLIHDFFAEAWEGLTSRYDPNKGRFEVYVFSAFVRFARPRILRLHRLQSGLLDSEEFANIADTRVDVGREFEFSHDSRVVAHAMERLPPFERKVLSGYINSPTHSERMLARELSVSRYRLRESLVEALGRVTVLLDKPEYIPAKDWSVARAIWQEERSVSDAAQELRLTEHQVREAHSRNTKLLAEALRYHQHMRADKKRSNTMGSQPKQGVRILEPSPLTTHALLEQVLKSPGNDDLLEEVRRRAEEILNYLETSEEDVEDSGFSDQDLEWRACVFESLAKADDLLSEDEIETVNALFEANAENEGSIGDAYKLALLPGLPPSLQHLERRFKGLKTVSEREAEAWLNSPAAKAALPFSEPLASYGVTPMTVFHATQALSTLTYRLRLHKVISESGPILLNRSDSEDYLGFGDLLDQKMVVREIRNLAECREDVAGLILPWMVDVARYKPQLFVGFKAEQQGKGIRLSESPEIKNVYERWRISPEKQKREWSLPVGVSR